VNPQRLAPRNAAALGPAAAGDPFAWRNGLNYGLLGFALAFVALPLYVILPNHYAREFGVPLSTLGALLLGARLFDAFIDPLLGRWSDRLFQRSSRAVLLFGAAAAVLLGAGFTLLFFPPVQAPRALLLWAAALLVLTYAAYSAVSVAHQAWGAMWGGSEAQRGRVVAWREGLGLAGVLVASVAPSVWGLEVSTAIFLTALALGWWAWTGAARPAVAPARAELDNIWLPFSRPAFRRLLLVFMFNGIASAAPATLVLFFIQDKLQAPADSQGLFLGAYFLCAALSIPAWLQLVKRLGLARTWGLGMLLAIGVFAFATQIGAGDILAFALICALSGVALGADLGLPSAMLAGVIGDAGDRGRSEGAYFGWWNFCTKLNLALAAGLALPFLAWFGYAPGARGDEALQALVIAYCVLPCVLKLVAFGALYALFIRGSHP
jgi:glycoside/pentoside/hexuronide:cation symporter, GPH family